MLNAFLGNLAKLEEGIVLASDVHGGPANKVLAVGILSDLELDSPDRAGAQQQGCDTLRCSLCSCLNHPR
jgi:hypothetical protein